MSDRVEVVGCPIVGHLPAVHTVDKTGGHCQHSVVTSGQPRWKSIFIFHSEEIVGHVNLNIGPVDGDIAVPVRALHLVGN